MIRRAPSPSLLPAVILIALAASCGRGPTSGQPQIIVLGIDGMDPTFLERHWASLPQLDRLRREGGFQRLATTMPPQSPVAWSTFITGLNPDGHGIYDFVHRDLATRMPRTSMSEIQPGRRLSLGQWTLPLTADRIVNQRRGTAFWELLSKAGVPAAILRMPTDFPPLECEAHSLAGMGTPDLLGTFGTFTLFTNLPDWNNRPLTGGVVKPVELRNHTALLPLRGPVNPFHRPEANATIHIKVAVDPDQPIARFDVDGAAVILRQGETSDWIPVRFPLLPGGLAGARGMIRLYAKQLQPRLAVYVSPVNIDPRAPAMPVSSPAPFAGELATAVGSAYYTQGMPYDTAAFRHGVFTREEYRAHSREVSRQTISLLRAALGRFREGLLFFHFFGVDQDAHLLWGRYDEELLETYRMVDDALGMVRAKAPSAMIVVLSDHGFARFDRTVHLNTWLLREGFLSLKQPGLTGPEELFANVDWDRTQAYALGLNSLYLHRPPESDDGNVLGDIEARLLTLRDPASGARVVNKVLRTHNTGGTAPDLIVGYAPGYRGSWQTALGAVPGVIVEDNTDEWRGDHCIDPDAVPGVLLSSRGIAATSPRLEDLPVSLLQFFGVAPEPAMKGRNVFAPPAR